jgi:hypothetical protein
VPRLFALDHNFPDPIVSVLAGFQTDAELVRIDQIHSGMADLDDWELLLALHQRSEAWDGLITTDSSTAQSRTWARHADPDQAHPGRHYRLRRRSRQSFGPAVRLPQRYLQTHPARWSAGLDSQCGQPPRPEAMGSAAAFADHNNRTTEEVWGEFRLTGEQLASDPLADW